MLEFHVGAATKRDTRAVGGSADDRSSFAVHDEHDTVIIINPMKQSFRVTATNGKETNWLGRLSFLVNHRTRHWNLL